MSIAVQSRASSSTAMGISRASAIDVDEPINVDDFDDDIVFTGMNPGPSMPVLVVSDSEDEAPRAGPSNRRQLFSPPPPPQHRAIPPVPPLPAHLQALAPIPRAVPRHRPRHPRHPGGVIRPMAEPMAWELRPQPPPDAPPMHLLPNRGAPRSQHQPVMGLGGALFALNESPENGHGRHRWRNTIHDDNFGLRDQDDPPRTVHRVGWVDRLASFMHTTIERATGWPAHFDYGHDEDEAVLVHRMLTAGDWGDLGPFGYNAMLRNPRPELREVDYKPEYTHPNPTPPGFSYDFDISPASDTIVIDDSPGPSRAPQPSKSETLFVCARCTHPLLTEGGGEMDEEKQHANRVWALRCGHMLDGRCIDELSVPPILPAVEGSDVKPDTKGKGKSREVAESEDELLLKATETAGRRKRRGRKAIHDSTSDIRSRLRSRGSGADVPPEEPLRTAPQKRDRKGRGKGKGKGRGYVAEEQYNWCCPVCDQVHISIKMGEEPWSQHKQSGAIVLYV